MLGALSGHWSILGPVRKNTGSANLSLRIIDTILSVRQYQHYYVT